MFYHVKIACYHRGIGDGAKKGNRRRENWGGVGDGGSMGE